MTHKPFIYFKNDIAGDAVLFSDPIELITAHTKSEFFAALKQIEAARQNGKWAAGFISYEAGYLFEEKLSERFTIKRAKSKTPLLLFGIFEGPSRDIHPIMLENDKEQEQQAPYFSDFKADWDFETYQKNFDILHDHIARGNCYQGNLTFPIQTKFMGDPIEAFKSLAKRQPVKYSAFVGLNEDYILSRSPELFFKTNNEGWIEAHPMKGTAPRSKNETADLKTIDALKSDPKSQAENLMIVDLMRNDISRISQVATLNVPEIFGVETYPTVHQMISRIKAKLKSNISVTDIFRALFPCGSITGAPKLSAMEILDDLEDAPRNAYCGSIGYIGPGDQMLFNVAIRTITLHDKNKAASNEVSSKATLNVGGGIVWDSNAKDEYEEALLKAQYVAKGQFITPANFSLIETFKLSKNGFTRLPLHLGRLKSSSKELGFKLDIAKIIDALHRLPIARDDQRIRLELHPSGKFELNATPHVGADKVFNIAIAKTTLLSGNFVLQHKTTKRDVYETARAEFSISEIDEVLLQNQRDELCEGTFTNLFIRTNKNSVLLTPPLKCGLLAGVLRQELLDSGKAIETIITKQDLLDCEAIYIGNSLRGLIKAKLAY